MWCKLGYISFFFFSFMKYMLIVSLDSDLLWKLEIEIMNLGFSLSDTSFPPAPGSIHMPRTGAVLVLKAKRPKPVQELPTCVHHSLSSCSPSGHIYPFWLEGESIVKHTDSLRLSPRAAFGLRQRKIFFFSLCIISYCNQTLDGEPWGSNPGW